MNREIPTPHMGDDQLLDLVHGLGTAETAADASLHLRACTACEARFRLLANDREAIRAAVQPQWVDGEIVLPAAVPTSEHSARGAPRWRAWALPAGTALAAGLAFLVITTARERTPPTTATTTVPVAWKEIWIERPELTNARSFESSRDTLGLGSLLAALDAYDHRDPARVITLLRQRRAPRFDQVARLFLASSLYNMKQCDAAIQELTAPGINVKNWPQPAAGNAQAILLNALGALGRSPDTQVLRDALHIEDRDGVRAP